MRFYFNKFIFIPAWLFFSAAAAQQITISDEVYTDVQARAGQLLYEHNCKRCHELGFYGNNLVSWTDITVLDYWYKILGNMPADNAGSLSRTKYL